MKRKFLYFEGASKWNKMLRHFKKIYHQIKELVNGENYSQNKHNILAEKLSRIYDKIQRMQSRVGVKIAGTALMIMLAAGTANAQFQWKLQPGNLQDVTMTDINVTSNAAPLFGDLDNDGDMDLYCGHVSGKVYFFENNGTGQFLAGTLLQGGGSDIYSPSHSVPKFSDIDDDGNLDIVLVNRYGPIKYYSGDGAGNFASGIAVTYDATAFDGNYCGVAFADMDSDGDEELFFSTGTSYIPNDIMMYENDATGTADFATGIAFSAGGSTSFGGSKKLDFYDLDNDGDLDLYLSGMSGDIYFCENDGANNFASPINLKDENDVNINAGSRPITAFADIDGDGKEEMYVGISGGTIQVYKQYVPHPSGNALDFDGVDDYVLLPNETVNNLSAGTMESWIYMDDNTKETIFIKQWDGNNSYAWLRVENGKLIFHTTNAAGDVTGNSTLNTGEWYHVAATFNATELNLYINGALDKTAAGDFTIPDQLEVSYTVIGTLIWDSHYFDGKIDEFRIWNVVRSQAEIEADMDNYITDVHGQWANLTAYYRLDQGNAGTDNTGLVNEVIDYKGCNKGILTNFTLNSTTSNWVTTTNNEAPILTTTDTGIPTFTGTTVTGTIFSIGKTSVTTRGFCYSTSDCPTISDNIVNETGTYIDEAYSLSITNLTLETTYYVRAYATNTQGTSYGETMSFTTEATSPSGNALNFDGTNDKVVANISTTVTGNFTLETWVKPDNTNNLVIISSRQPSEYGFYLQMNGGNTIHADIGNGSNWITTNADATYNYTPGTWYHIAFVVTNTSYSIYVNGNLEGSGTYSGTPLLFDGTHNLQIGAQDETDYFDGQIDEVRIWNNVRTETEIQNNMYNIIADPGSEANLIAYYNFDETTGTTLTDQSNNANNGTLTNMFGDEWTESYAMVVPIPITATNILSDGFTANWTPPAIGIAESYILDVSEITDFSTFVSGYETLNVGDVQNYDVTGLVQGTTYYYRVRAEKSTVPGTGGFYRDNIEVTTEAIYDFGDLPTSYAITTLANDGARHQLSVNNQLMLGVSIDDEADGQEDPTANGDGIDDDGITITSDWEEGTDGGAIEVEVSGGGGYLSGWIDWNEDDDFDDEGEQILNQKTVLQNLQTVTFDIPEGAIGGTGTFNRFARFRLYNEDTYTATTTGLAVNGEVEDYQLEFNIPSNFIVEATTPANGATVVPSNQVISIEFNLNPDIATISSSSFIVDGTVSGEILGTYDINDRILTFTANELYNSGEEIAVTLTTDITSANGLSLSETYSWSFTIEIVEPPIIEGQPTDIVMCAGDEDIFTLFAIESGVINYEWQADAGLGLGFFTLIDNETYTGTSTNELNLTNVSHLLNNFEYRCIVSNETGEEISDTVLLTVNGQLAITGEDYAYYSETYPIPTIDDLLLTAEELIPGVDGLWSTNSLVTILEPTNWNTLGSGFNSGISMFVWTISDGECFSSDSLEITIGASFIPSTYTVTWEDPSNWTPPAVPGPNDSVAVFGIDGQTTRVYITSADAICNRLLVGTNAELYVSGDPAKGEPGNFTVNSVIIQQDIDKFPNLRGPASLNVGSGGSVIIQQDIDKKQSRGPALVVGSGGSVIIQQDIDKNKTEPATLTVKNGNDILIAGTDSKQPKAVASLNIGNGGSVIIQQDIDKRAVGNLRVGNNATVTIQQNIEKSDKGGENLIVNGGSVIIQQDIDKANYNSKGANFTVTGGSVIIQQNIDKGGAGNFEVGNGGSVIIQQDIDKGGANLTVGAGGSVIIQQDIDKNLKGNANLNVRGGSVIIQQDIDKGFSGNLQVGNGGSVIIQQDIDKSSPGTITTPAVDITNGEIIIGNVGLKGQKGNASLNTNHVIIQQDIDKGKTTTEHIYIYSNGDISFDEENELLYSEFIYMDTLTAMTIENGGVINFSYPNHNKYTVVNGASIIDSNDVTMGNNAKYINNFYANDTKFFSVPLQGETNEVFGDEIVYSWTENTASWDIAADDISPVSGYKTTFATSQEISFQGTLLSGNQTYTTTANASLPFRQKGWNFVGNPYPSYVDFNLIELTNIAPIKYTYNNLTNSFEIYSQNGLSLNGGNQYIEDVQGFFVKATEDGSFDFTNAQRLHFFEQVVKQEPKDGEVLTLKVTDDGTNNDYMQIIFDETATENYDIDKDVPAITASTSEFLSLCVVTPNSEELAINSMPSPVDATQIYSMYFNPSADASYTISVEELTIDAGITIHLNDNELEVVTDLHSVPEYTFSANSGDETDRFTLHFNDDFVNIKDDNETEKYSDISIYSYNNIIYVNNKVNENYTVEIYDVLGTKIMEKSIIGKGLNSFEMNNASNCYIVKVKTADYFISKSLFVW